MVIGPEVLILGITKDMNLVVLFTHMVGPVEPEQRAEILLFVMDQQAIYLIIPVLLEIVGAVGTQGLLEIRAGQGQEGIQIQTGQEGTRALPQLH